MTDIGRSYYNKKEILDIKSIIFLGKILKILPERVITSTLSNRLQSHIKWIHFISPFENISKYSNSSSLQNIYQYFIYKEDIVF